MNYIINLLKNKNSDLTIPRRFNLKHTTMNENIDLTNILDGINLLIENLLK